MNSKQHWDTVYATKGERDVSWFEPSPDVSLAMIEAAGLTHDTCVIDIGGGESRLVDALVERGVTCVAVLDVAREALLRAQRRLGDKASEVAWIQADVTGAWSWKDVGPVATRSRRIPSSSVVTSSSAPGERPALSRIAAGITTRPTLSIVVRMASTYQL
jgi:hypothetical protein